MIKVFSPSTICDPYISVPENALLPIDSILSGRSTSFKFVQPENAFLHIDVIPSSITTFSIKVSSLNGELSFRVSVLSNSPFPVITTVAVS